MIEEIILFPSKEKALAVIQTLKEWKHLIWDGCNGIEISDFSEDSEEDSIYTLETVVFRTFIALEDTEYCKEYDYCPRIIICLPGKNKEEQKWHQFRRKTNSEDIRGKDEPLTILMLDESYLFYGSKNFNEEEMRRQILLNYQHQWRDVERKRQVFQDIKNNPELRICLGEQGLELSS